jgi:hypothetical protein
MLIARGLAAAAILAAAGAPAAADELRATRGQPLDEISHTVAVRIADGVATYTVQRQFHNRGKVAEEARLSIDLPAGAAATGLRIRASGKWHTGELLDRDVAAERYRELTGAGVHDPKDPALLFWISASELYLQVFPVLPGTTNTVEYTLTVPTRYAAGRYWLTYPRVDPAAARSRPWARKLVDPVVTVHPAWASSAGGVVIDGKPAAPGQAVALAPRGRAPWQAAAAAAAEGDDDAADGDPDADLRHAASVLEVPASPQAQLRYTLAKVRVALRHPARSDLDLQLVTPAGALVEVARGSSDTIEEHAVFDVRFPAPVRAAGRWRLVVRSNAADAGALVRWSLTLGDRTFAADTPAFVPGGSDLPGVAVVGVEPPPMTAWAGRLGRVVASSAHAFARLELEAAPRLSAVPRRAQVVFVLDASHSAAHLLDAQLAIVRAYLAHVPDAELEVVAVRRRAARLFGRFATAAEARHLLDAAVRAGALAPGNGSALDDGARLAASLLAGRTGPLRVVLATDELLRSGLSDAAALAALAALPPAAVVHVVVPSTDPTGAAPAGAAPALPSLTRDDSAPLAALAAAHHGILARIAGVPAKAPDLEPVVLELVRPTRIEHLAITGASPFGVADVLREGEGLRLFESGVTAAEAPSSLALTGKLWSDPVRLDLTAAPGFSNATAAFVFGSEGRHDHLSAAEQRTIALAARAVSPVTSYLAIEPGVRPSKIGLDDEETGNFGWGYIGTGSYGTVGRHGVRLKVKKPDLASLVPTAACLRRHPPRGPWSVRLAVETTKDEIVDIEVTGGAGPLATCLAEAAWSIRLPSIFNLERDHHTADLSGS